MLLQRLTRTFCIAALALGYSTFAAAQDSDSSTQSLSPSEIIVIAIQNELAFDTIQGEYRYTLLLGMIDEFELDDFDMEDLEPDAWATFVLDDEWRYSFDGGTTTETSWVGGHDGETIARIFPDSGTAEIFPSSVLYGKPWDLSYRALGPIPEIQDAIRPLNTLDGAPQYLNQIDFRITDESPEKVTIEGLVQQDSFSYRLSISFLPQKGYSVSRITHDWIGAESWVTPSIKYFDNHVKTEAGHWIPTRIRYDMGFGERSEILDEIQLSYIETDIEIDDDTFDATSIAYEQATILDYRTFKHWLAFWLIEYGPDEHREALDSMQDAYPMLLPLTLAIVLAIAACFSYMAYRIRRGY